MIHSRYLKSDRGTQLVKPELEDHPLPTVRNRLFNIFAGTLHNGGRSSNRNMRTRHAVVTGTQGLLLLNILKAVVSHSIISVLVGRKIMCRTQLGEQSVPDQQNEEELGFSQFTVTKQVAYNSNSHTVITCND